MSDITEQIKERLDVVEFLKNYVQLHPAGKNLKALCPFHKEKTPSFMVSPERQSWHCFGGCNDGGDIFKFLMKYENLEFYEALKILAEKAGVEMKKRYGADAGYGQYEILYEINNCAKDFFKSQLNGPALDYFLKRGLKKETISEFELGAAPASSDQLLRHLTGLGFGVQDIEKSGLAFRTDRGTYWDRFRQRLMFPLYNSFGRAVGFTGRVFQEEAGSSIGQALAKYVNSPETAIFRKSKLLYGFHLSKNYIRELREALLVEGQMDFLMAYQNGVKNTVAVSGTALALDQLKSIRRLADRLIIGFDSDEAGQLAAERSIDLAAAADFSVRTLFFSEDKDIADIALKNPEAVAELLKQAEPASDFYFRRYPVLEVSAADQKKNIRIILNKVKAIFSSVDQSYWIKELSHRSGIREESLIEELEKTPRTFKAEQPFLVPGKIESAAESDPSRAQLIAQRIIDLGGELPADFTNLAIISEQSGFKASLENSRLDSQEMGNELKILNRQLKLEIIKGKIQALRRDIIKAEQSGDDRALDQALKDFDMISKEFHNITNEESSPQGEKESFKAE